MKHGHFEISDWDEGIEGLGSRDVILEGVRDIVIAKFYGNGTHSLRRAEEYIDLIEGREEGQTVGQEVGSQYKGPSLQEKDFAPKANIPDVPRRYLRIKFFLGSTTEEIQRSLNAFLENENICIGNFVDLKLWKEGSVYQVALVYAQLVT